MKSFLAVAALGSIILAGCSSGSAPQSTTTTAATRFTTTTGVATLPGFPASDPTQPATVPATYQATYATLQSQLSAFSSLPTAARGPATSDTVVASALQAADGNAMTPGVLQSGLLKNAEGMVSEMKTMGETGVTVQVSYPLLVPIFPGSSTYASFYSELAQYIHSQGMTLIVEDNPLFPSQSGLPVSSFYRGLNLTTFISTDQQQAQAIINDLHPTYLEILAEPDTYTLNIHNPGINLNDAGTAIQFVSGVLAGLQRNGTKVGAGTGTWQDGSEDEALIKGTSIDFMDMHTYPIATVDISNMNDQVTEAAAARLPVVMTECGLYKDSTNGVPLDTSTSASQEEKSVSFAFWEPLDEEFLTDIVNYARNNGFAAVSPFDTLNFFAYLPWSSSLDAAPASQVRQSFYHQVTAARQANVVSQVGGTLEKLNEIPRISGS